MKWVIYCPGEKRNTTRSANRAGEAPSGASGTWAEGALQGRRYTIIPLLALLALAPAGCKQGPSSRARYLQSKRLVGVTVVQRFSDPVVSIEALARVQPVAGSSTGEGVTVQHPRGLDRLAEQIAREVPRMAAFAQEQFGITWTWQARLRLLRVEEAPSRFVERRRRLESGTFTMALFVPPDETLESVYRANRLFPASFIHEMTELSLAFPPEGRNPVLLDYRGEDFQETGYTRWFRDGLASYIGERVAEEVFRRPHYERLHRRPFSALHFLGKLVFDWRDTEYSISDDFRTEDEDFYRAGMGLFYLMESRHGRKAVGRVIGRFSRQKLLNREGLFRAFEEALGESPAKLLRELQLPWLGVQAEAFTRSTALGLAKEFQPGVLVVGVAPDSPAAEAGLKPGDVVVRIQGYATPTVDELERGLFRTTGLSIDVHFIRSGRQGTLTVPRKRRPEKAPQSWVREETGGPRGAGSLTRHRTIWASSSAA